MKTIFKYPIAVTDIQDVEMPKEAQILAVQCQHGEPCIWALVDTEQPMEHRWFRMFGTGHPCDGIDREHYVGTFQLQGGTLVFHLFAER